MISRIIAASIGILAAVTLNSEAGARPSGVRAPAALKAHPAKPLSVNTSATGLTRSHPFALRPHAGRAMPWRRAYPYPWVGSVYCSVDGACDDPATPPFGLPSDEAVAAPLRAAPSLRPDCRMETQTRVVAAEAGGERTISIRRCVPAVAEPSRSEGRLIDREPGFDMAVSDLAVAGVGMPAKSRECRTQSWSVHAEGGGERTVTIRRC
jgi:hypothetical protein